MEMPGKVSGQQTPSRPCGPPPPLPENCPNLLGIEMPPAPVGQPSACLAVHGSVRFGDALAPRIAVPIPVIRQFIGAVVVHSQGAESPQFTLLYFG